MQGNSVMISRLRERFPNLSVLPGSVPGMQDFTSKVTDRKTDLSFARTGEFI
jgi:hypothetical protein